MGSLNPTEVPCWVTLITKSSYLPGAVILGHSLDKQGSQYPLVVQYTDSLGEEAIAALNAEAKHGRRLVPMHVDLLLPRAGQENVGSVADRFKDTFTKLRAFELHKLGYTKVCFLDADMAVFRNPDEVFDLTLPGRDWLGANHACVCNLDNDKWAPDIWNKGNCPFTLLTSPDQVVGDIRPGSRPTYRLLNGGALLFYPTERLWTQMLDTFNTTDKLKTYQFPDQDFLADFFWDKWQPISWKYNAIKTMRYWHPWMWSDEEVVIVHYIVDKPWERKVSPEGIAGYLGRDGELHNWWWGLNEEWFKCRKDADPVILKTMNKLVNQNNPFTDYVPMIQDPGKPEDVQPHP